MLDYFSHAEPQKVMMVHDILRAQAEAAAPTPLNTGQPVRYVLNVALLLYLLLCPSKTHTHTHTRRFG